MNLGRDDAIAAQYRAGQTMQSIADDIGLSKGRVQQILASRGEVEASEARAARAQMRLEAGSAKASAFWSEHSASILALAADGASKQDIVDRFSLLYPRVPEETVRYALDNSGISFSRKKDPHHFSDSVIESGVWYICGLSLGLSPDPGAALIGVDVEEATGLRLALEERGVSEDEISKVIAICVVTKELSLARELELTKVRYTSVRAPFIKSQNLGSAQHAWPADAQTVMKRIGKGYWGDAMTALGISPGKRGRARGLLLFQENAYPQALRSYIAASSAIDNRTSASDYDVWRQREYRAGRTWPAGVSIRNKYGSWAAAMRAGTTPTEELSKPQNGRRAQNISAELLHITRRDMTDKMKEISSSPTADVRDPLIRSFLVNYAGAFEINRREWLREMIFTDPSSLDRRLDPTAPTLGRRQRAALTSSPVDWDSVLTDMYLDRTLSDGGLTNADGWLSPDVQAELDALPNSANLLYGVLRAARNYFTHDSSEARLRMTEALSAAGDLDSDFRFNQPLTQVSLIRWLAASSAKRLSKVAMVMPEVWKAMVAAEGVLRAEVDSRP